MACYHTPMDATYNARIFFLGIEYSTHFYWALASPQVPCWSLKGNQDTTFTLREFTGNQKVKYLNDDSTEIEFMMSKVLSWFGGGGGLYCEMRCKVSSLRASRWEMHHHIALLCKIQDLELYQKGCQPSRWSWPVGGWEARSVQWD